MAHHDPSTVSQVILIFNNFWLLVGILLHLFAALDLIHKNLGGFKAGDVVLIYNNGRVARNISGNLLFSLLVDKTSEAAHINIVAVTHIALYYTEKCFNRCGNIALVYSGLVCNLIDNV